VLVANKLQDVFESSTVVCELRFVRDRTALRDKEGEQRSGLYSLKDTQSADL
jgi:hypothetical protein